MLKALNVANCIVYGGAGIFINCKNAKIFNDKAVLAFSIQRHNLYAKLLFFFESFDPLLCSIPLFIILAEIYFSVTS